MNIKILVCYHKKSPVIANDILKPILLGNASQSTIKSLQNSCKKHNVDMLYDSMISTNGGGQ